LGAVERLIGTRPSSHKRPVRGSVVATSRLIGLGFLPCTQRMGAKGANCRRRTATWPSFCHVAMLCYALRCVLLLLLLQRPPCTREPLQATARTPAVDPPAPSPSKHMAAARRLLGWLSRVGPLLLRHAHAPSFTTRLPQRPRFQVAVNGIIARLPYSSRS
jgi:hypothetical protein